MERLTAAWDSPARQSLASFPVSYRASTLKVDGALLFRVFDGTVAAKNLVPLVLWGAFRLTGREMRGATRLLNALFFGSIRAGLRDGMG